MGFGFEWGYACVVVKIVEETPSGTLHTYITIHPIAFYETKIILRLNPRIIQVRCGCGGLKYYIITSAVIDSRSRILCHSPLNARSGWTNNRSPADGYYCTSSRPRTQLRSAKGHSATSIMNLMIAMIILRLLIQAQLFDTEPPAAVESPRHNVIIYYH